MAVVYRHLREDTLEPFYIGIGKNKKRAFCFDKYDRSSFWTKYKNKHGCIVDIIFEGISWEDACSIEIFLIKIYGRINNNTGILVNLTDGGEGSLGVTCSIDTRNKMSKSRTGRVVSELTREKIRNSLIGKKHSESRKENIRKSKINKKQSSETIKKRAEKQIGRKHTDATKEKMRISALGRGLGLKHTEEHKAKISASLIARNKKIRECQI